MSTQLPVRLSNCAVLIQSGIYAPMVSFEGKHYARNEVVPIAILGDRSDINCPLKVFTASLFVAWCMAEDFKRITEWPALARLFVFPGEVKKQITSLFQQSKPSFDK